MTTSKSLTKYLQKTQAIKALFNVIKKKNLLIDAHAEKRVV